MNASLRVLRALGTVACVTTLWTSVALADSTVALTANANPEYTKRKYESGRTRTESYVLMEGKFEEGTTADRSIDKMSFRQIAEFLAPELAKQRYLPTPDVKNADLLLVVHWGTTIPHVSSEQMKAVVIIDLEPAGDKPNGTNGVAPQETSAGAAAYVEAGGKMLSSAAFDQAMRQTDALDTTKLNENAQALGYTQELNRRKDRMFSSAQEVTMRSDLTTERYFIIIKAYDLKEKVAAGQTRKVVWTLHLNMRSAGQNFPTALTRMADVAVNFVGRSTDGMQSDMPKFRHGQVTPGSPRVVEEKK
ncbi:MAG TPA: hypothetical protein VHO24_14690 [Opitutaceae bacterium]|nr:hypothetical protein [Opitutaceae bacterium]